MKLDKLEKEKHMPSPVMTIVRPHIMAGIYNITILILYSLYCTPTVLTILYSYCTHYRYLQHHLGLVERTNAEGLCAIQSGEWARSVVISPDPYVC
jgi:hypothetical protein